MNDQGDGPSSIALIAFIHPRRIVYPILIRNHMQECLSIHQELAERAVLLREFGQTPGVAPAMILFLAAAMLSRLDVKRYNSVAS